MDPVGAFGNGMSFHGAVHHIVARIVLLLMPVSCFMFCFAAFAGAEVAIPGMVHSGCRNDDCHRGRYPGDCNDGWCQRGTLSPHGWALSGG